MLVGLDVGATREYTSKYDPNKDDPMQSTIFVLSTLDSRVLGKLKDQAARYRQAAPGKRGKGAPASEEVDIDLRLQDMHFAACQYGIVGWSNFKDKDGNDIEFKTVKHFAGKQYQIVDPEVLARLPGAVIRELSEEIRRDNDLDEEDEKN